MDVSQIHLDGKNDALLCDCAHEFRKLSTLEISFDLRVVDMLVYTPRLDVVDVEHESFGISTSTFAVPVSMRKRVLRASGECPSCGIITYEISFDGSQIVRLETVRG